MVIIITTIMDKIGSEEKELGTSIGGTTTNIAPSRAQIAMYRLNAAGIEPTYSS